MKCSKEEFIWLVTAPTAPRHRIVQQPNFKLMAQKKRKKTVLGGRTTALKPQIQN